jgi:hypothetical protein
MSPPAVIPAQAGIQPFQQIGEELDRGLTSSAVESRRMTRKKFRRSFESHWKI